MSFPHETPPTAGATEAVPVIHPLLYEGPLPAGMNDPFDYAPHEVVLRAVEAARPDIDALMDGETEGKMFGVLVVGGASLGYLVAYSGQVRGRSDWPGFVPAVFDYLQPDGHFRSEEAVISHLNQQVADLEQSPERLAALSLLATARQEAGRTINDYRHKMFLARERRRQLRTAGPLSSDREQQLVRESQFQKAELRRLRQRENERVAALEQASEAFEEPLRQMKAERRQRSDALQQWLFRHFEMLNAQGERRNLLDIFRQTSLSVPPGGAGECCEPKLLQYAYQHQLQPVQMGMFWVGPSPQVEIRHDGRFYPACRGKCLPILRWMLPRETQPRVVAAATQAELPILYEDDDLVVVNKPAGLLSIPGISEYYSVWTIMRSRYPDTDSPLLVHRLDQPTSGVLLVAKTRRAHRELQRQFMDREVEKQYVALLERPLATLPTAKGDLTLSLPLYSDPLNRPYQSVDRTRGKQAVTVVRLLGNTQGHARVLLSPKTGRTHQLRVHCAHAEGLGNPILGDNLYGQQPARRLFLHAQSLSFCHPTTGQRLTFTAPPDF